MMKTKNSNRWQCAKALAVIPVAAVAIVAFASPKVEQAAQKVVAESEEIVKSVTNDMMQTEIQANDVATVENSSSMASFDVQPAPEQNVSIKENIATAQTDSIDDDKKPAKMQMPTFPGGQKAMMQYLAENVKYPASARQKKITGRVIIQFVVEKDGSITEAKVMKSVAPELDAEALRIVNSMPKWTPAMQDGKAVRVKFFIPIVFSDGESHKDEKKTEATAIHLKGKVKINDETVTKNADEIVIISPEPMKKAQPLYIIDGKEATSLDVGKTPVENIEKMEVLKDKTAIEKYGEKGKNGVVVITLKK